MAKLSKSLTSIFSGERRLIKKFDKIVERIETFDFVDALEPLVTQAKKNAPVKTGKLRKSIRVQADSVTVGEFYSKFQEFGTTRIKANPFFRKAIKQSERMQQLLKRSI